MLLAIKKEKQSNMEPEIMSRPMSRAAATPIMLCIFKVSPIIQFNTEPEIMPNRMSRAIITPIMLCISMAATTTRKPITSTIKTNGVAIPAQAQPIVLRANPASLAAMVNFGSLGGKVVYASAITAGGKGACPWEPSTGKDIYKGGRLENQRVPNPKGKAKTNPKEARGKAKSKA